MDDYVLCDDLEECLRMLTKNNQLAVALSKQYAMNNLNIPDWQIHCFDDNNQISSYPVAILIRSDHPLKARIAQIVAMAKQGGLIDKWFKDNRPHNKEPVPSGATHITIEDLTLPAVVYIVFVVFAVMAFIAERLIHSNLRRNSSHWFWRRADAFIDGRRHFLINFARNRD